MESLVDEQRKLRSSRELDAVVKHAGIAASDTVVVYCHVGVDATGSAFAARMTGWEARLYQGSFNDRPPRRSR
jgi:thiosulfate/3-mercaptopyruvate sulfurtransferase